MDTKMKRLLPVLFVFILVIIAPATVFAVQYSDATAQIEFEVPSGWTEKPLSQEREIVKAKFVCDETGEIILFGYGDIWNEQNGYARSEINNSFLTYSDISQMYGVSTSSIKKVLYGSYDEYFQFPSNVTTNVNGKTITIDTVSVIRIYNGYLYEFQYFGRANNLYYIDFERLLYSVKYLAAPQQPQETFPVTYSDSTNSYDIFRDWNANDFLLSLICTVIIYSLPIMIYRYLIRKKPLDARKAKRVTIIYGICSFIVMSIILYILGNAVAGSSILLWSYVNYRMLIGGKDRTTDNFRNPYISKEKEQYLTESQKHAKKIGKRSQIDEMKEGIHALERLASLHDNGTLTDAEYADAKKALLNKLNQ